MDNIYWIVMLDNIKNLCKIVTVLGIISTVGGIIFICGAFIEGLSASLRKTSITVAVLAFCIFITGILGRTFIPNTKQMIAIITIPKIINNEQIQDMPDNALKLINKKLKEWAKETEIMEETK